MHNSSNPNKNYFQHAVARNQVLTAVLSKKYCKSVKMANILRNVPELCDFNSKLFKGWLTLTLAGEAAIQAVISSLRKLLQFL